MKKTISWFRKAQVAITLVVLGVGFIIRTGELGAIALITSTFMAFIIGRAHLLKGKSTIALGFFLLGFYTARLTILRLIISGVGVFAAYPATTREQWVLSALEPANNNPFVILFMLGFIFIYAGLLWQHLASGQTNENK